ncbi:IS66 family insertion sequence element accessory protein TnpB [Paracoccus sp. Ld10]|uniref:IS66 family insertion sequence element accessory protein TnpB n=1 Tax=Paracoccus sp. Ld10 TaxID=649158 RepID=UPI0038709EF4
MRTRPPIGWLSYSPKIGLRLSQDMRISVATKPVDFRTAQDRLAALVQSMRESDPFSGTVPMLRAKRADELKSLLWDSSGLVMAYKRLEGDNVTWPAVRVRQ